MVSGEGGREAGIGAEHDEECVGKALVRIAQLDDGRQVGGGRGMGATPARSRRPRIR